MWSTRQNGELTYPYGTEGYAKGVGGEDEAIIPAKVGTGDSLCVETGGNDEGGESDAEAGNDNDFRTAIFPVVGIWIYRACRWLGHGCVDDAGSGCQGRGSSGRRVKGARDRDR